MATRLSEITPEHLGDIATEADVAEFVGWARELMVRDGLTEEQAVTTLWDDGDYYSQAYLLGLADPEVGA